MINLNTNLQSKKLLVTKIIIIMNKIYNWSLNLFLKLTTMVFASKWNWLLKISYLDFGYQNDLVTKLISN